MATTGELEDGLADQAQCVQHGRGIHQPIDEGRDAGLIVGDLLRDSPPAIVLDQRGLGFVAELPGNLEGILPLLHDRPDPGPSPRQGPGGRGRRHPHPRQPDRHLFRPRAA